MPTTIYSAQNHTMAIRSSSAKPGDHTLETREPTVGKWYCGVTLGEGASFSYGELARYEGEGCWSGDDKLSEIAKSVLG